jgi:nicotinamide-nucleotide amidase
MKIEIVTTGDEVMQGTIVDTNTAWIAERCARLGHEIARHTSIADDLDDIGDVLRAAVGRAHAVITTGGLGPTADDVTIEAFARAFDLPLVMDEAVLAGIRDYLNKVGRKMGKSNEKQALIPKGSSVIKNPVGTAPGVMMDVGGVHFIFLPGVPKELYRMFDDSVMPWLFKRSTGAVKEKVFRCFGLPEATIDERLKGVDLKGARLSFRVKFPEILLKVVARAKDPSDAAAVLTAASDRIYERLQDCIYGEGEAGLFEVVGGMLAQKGLHVAIAESCTGGFLSNEITNVPGASEYFERGIVSYSNRAKMELLGIGEELLKAHGAVSPEVASSMASAIRGMSGADYGIGITGIAGPSGGTPEKPVGLVYIALAAPDGEFVFKYNFHRDRMWFKSLVAATAMDLIRRHMTGVLQGVDARLQNI